MRDLVEPLSGLFSLMAFAISVCVVGMKSEKTIIFYYYAVAMQKKKKLLPVSGIEPEPKE